MIDLKQKAKRFILGFKFLVFVIVGLGILMFLFTSYQNTDFNAGRLAKAEMRVFYENIKEYQEKYNKYPKTLKEMDKKLGKSRNKEMYNKVYYYSSENRNKFSLISNTGHNNKFIQIDDGKAKGGSDIYTFAYITQEQVENEKLSKELELRDKFLKKGLNNHNQKLLNYLNDKEITYNSILKANNKVDKSYLKEIVNSKEYNKSDNAGKIQYYKINQSKDIQYNKIRKFPKRHLINPKTLAETNSLEYKRQIINDKLNNYQKLALDIIEYELKEYYEDYNHYPLSLNELKESREIINNQFPRGIDFIGTGKTLNNLELINTPHKRYNINELVNRVNVYEEDLNNDLLNMINIKNNNFLYFRDQNKQNYVVIVNTDFDLIAHEAINKLFVANTNPENLELAEVFSYVTNESDKYKTGFVSGYVKDINNLWGDNNE